MKPYPKYKDSGIEWIGEIPERWSIAKIKFTDFVIMGQSPSSEDYNDSMIGLPFLQGNADFTSLYPIPRIWCDTANKKAKKGDILLSVRAPIGAVNVADQDYGIGRGLCAIRSLKTNPKLLFYFALSLNGELNKHGTGSTFTAIAADQVRNSKIPSIDSKEQESIFKYLDHKTARIDSLIEKKQRLIELVKEERTAVINEAVTKGLDPNAPMKDSGIEWLGEVPEHWETCKLKYLCALIKDGTHAPPQRTREGIPILSVRNIVGGKFINLPDDSNISSADFQLLQKSYDVRENDILLAIVGATLGKNAIVEKMSPFTIQRSLAYFRAKADVLYFKYLHLFFQSDYLQTILWQSVAFSAQPGIYLGTLENIHCAIPNIEEQKEIVQHIEKETTRIDSTISTSEQEIELLQEYRTALISEVVTGKIDVREEMI